VENHKASLSESGLYCLGKVAGLLPDSNVAADCGAVVHANTLVFASTVSELKSVDANLLPFQLVLYFSHIEYVNTR